ncbi:dnaJ homolog subfamily C member 9 [Daktulosphaira vitifoliae]|uniref:dnaJ homolog subfamily C member 9 n=1 Tax=Daktulosphaira vitifoliae TaxID=58002 RepID=UPI0021AAB513|nr:dnaJ homolog subfamily C member 9 [Daktulosphaira vitifoliae]
MVAFLELCRKYFDTDNLYDVLKTNKNATDKEVRKAYYVLSMKLHPDKVPENEKFEATEKFKVISQIHALLADPEKRKLYDTTGCVGDDIDPNTADDDFPWETYWRSIFKKITDDDIREFEKNYKGSDDEKRDLKKGYLAGKGDMTFIINMVPFSSVHEEDRLREILEKIIEEEDLPKYETFTNEPLFKKKRRLLKAKRQEAEFEKMQVELEKEKKSNKNDDNDLLLAIQKRSAERAEQMDDFLSRMEAKYCKPQPTTKGRKSNKRK